MSYRIIKEAPPASTQGRTNSGLRAFLTECDTNHRGEWLRLTKSQKNISYLYIVRRNYFPNMEIVTRKNTNGTFGVWVRFHDKPVKTRSNVGRKKAVKKS